MTPHIESRSVLGTLRHYAWLYLLFLSQNVKAMLEYRASFVIGVFSTFAFQLSGILTIWVVMSRVPLLNGWSLNEVLLIYGLVTLAKSLNHMFADNLWTVGRVYIRNGGFERFLVRPINPLFHLLADRFCQDGVGNFLIGLLLVVTAWSTLAIPLTVLNIVYIVVMVISGGAIFMALNLLTATTSFWIMDSVPVTRAVFDNHFFAQYPLSIYPGALQVIMTWIIPYAFCSFYPASYLLGRDVGVLAFASPVVAAVFLFIAYRAWLIGLRHYGGTGT